jgi:putative Holliday junction resolvase
MAFGLLEKLGERTVPSVFQRVEKMTANEPSEFPRTGRLAGIDFGTVRIGVAITDPEQKMASPYQILQRSNLLTEESFFRRLVREERISGFVVGLPVHLDGSSSHVSELAIEYGKWLGVLTGLPVVWFDERFTSSAAEELIREANLTSKKRKALLDKLAAQVLLTAFLEAPRDQLRTIRGLDDRR